VPLWKWTEALTLISQNNVPDSLYDSVHKHFNEKEMVALTMAIIAINAATIFLQLKITLLSKFQGLQ
jgi:alkylhydroperoxidase family enzyme